LPPNLSFSFPFASPPVSLFPRVKAKGKYIRGTTGIFPQSCYCPGCRMNGKSGQSDPQVVSFLARIFKANGSKIAINMDFEASTSTSVTHPPASLLVIIGNN